MLLTCLPGFQRAAVESGSLFEQGVASGDLHQRADQRLVRDPRQLLRRILLDNGLAPRFAHSLIGRAIFIRYLEDRGILKRSYFDMRLRRRVQSGARFNDADDETPTLGFESGERYFDKVLLSKDFTYAALRPACSGFQWRHVSAHESSERKNVDVDHLRLLRHFLS